MRREYAVPIERYGDDAAASRLRRIVSPFVLRRLKSDPAIIEDLPAKNEMKVVCTLPAPSTARSGPKRPAKARAGRTGG